MNFDHDFFQVSKLSEAQKKVFTQNGTLFSPNLGEDQKKGLYQKWNFCFPRIQVETCAQMHARVKLLGGCRPYSNYWGDTAKLLGDISPIPPGFRHPCLLDNG